MDQQPTTIIQHVYAAFGRGDVPAILESVTDDIDWSFVGDRRAAYTRQVRGKGQLGEWFSEVGMADDIQAFEPREFLAGSDHVTVIGWERTIARATGKTFESPWVHIWKLRSSKVSSFFGLLDSEAAAAARS